jgi:ribonuclease BN (tRNA processing enzyme)
VRFTVLGSGTTTPDPDRGPAGFLVEHGGRTILVDGGTGTMQRAARLGVDLREVDAIVYSHLHPDHSAELVPLLFSMRVGGRQRGVDVLAGTGFSGFLDRLRAAWGRWIEPPGAIRVRELSLGGPDGAELVGGLTLHTVPAPHPGNALHLRFSAGGRSVVFSGDTAWSDALVDLASGCDLLVCECAGSDEQPVDGHLVPSEVARLLGAARPQEAWITHLYPHVDPIVAMKTIARAGVPARRATDLDRWGTP